jgi:hypothetical protein
LEVKLERDFKGVWIKKEIWLDSKMSWMEKLFLTEIESLDNEHGCFASNHYFADFFQLSKGRCSEIINSLKDKGYFTISYEYDGKEVKNRIIKTRKEWSPNTYSENADGVFGKYGEGYSENTKDNNTYINNTINNISSEVEIPPSEPKLWNVDFDKQWGYIQDTERKEVFRLPCLSGKEYIVYWDMCDDWKKAYPACKILAELRGMKEWLLSNPKQMKTHNGMRRFITGWLSRTQNKGGSK